ncbi:MAG: phosphatidylserine decarboxylase family protein [Gammaproteobacteria bacterium]|nr:phosphatidylserine decarboxylase family protein [Gammaproteobacteria bacterium]NIR84274.1 phosphatidylserine decarboxylase family protein [Gammaproteobacteria bacterium]NIR89744.1 phosphatidylserine decarboxylase family protein [Gammaproteobacteria bacterium]NIU05432.1 phosphatidylserine decarboxylase family protein [Gammaproteobacteria bacterium]NIV52378.1 phosphatidylserine decarboxylase family protein [Gammaproteobacteria bacterium]
MIAREGWLPIFVTLGVASLLFLRAGPLWSAPAWGLALYLLFLFRFPSRRVPASPLAVVCPADGRIATVEQTRDPWLDRSALRVVVALAAPGVATLRSPTEGKVMDFWRARESGAARPRFRSLTRYTLWVRTDEGDDVVFSVLARAIVSRFKAVVAPGERIGQGKRFGFIYFGTRVEVFVPVNSRRVVAEGERVRAGSDVLTALIH